SEKNHITDFTIDPKKLGIAAKDYNELAPEKDIQTESKRFARLLDNQENSARKDAAILNAGLIFLAANKAANLEEAIEKAAKLLESGAAFKTLEKWVQAQNTNPEKGLKTLHRLMQ
ncbi:MAG: anthranilate phosphoribosyltransferase, partial [Desulfobacula sp.]|nr:anthranilate phosphoribosyltransferase [Desulfobacula sp.]